LAATQLSIAVFAIYSSNQDRLSDGACLGGVFGTLANVVIFVVVGIVSLVLTIRSLWAKTWHAGLAPLYFVLLTSSFSILIGQYAGLRCTV
ncbi:MAG: hypothetical protein NWP79_02770, partial [Paracoccaceae bacterium]|nr:hypothetical protein [Paracoccaceae bacterium]